MPFYVSPEQQMKDKADYARKGIARGRSAAVLRYDGGILLVADNMSRTLHKISEIYDRIAFAAVGRYNEFENLRQAGVQFADGRGYAYDRRDVTGRALANAYAQTLGMVFSESLKPYEVEIVVAELGETAEDDQLYRISFDGSVYDEGDYVAIGGQVEEVSRVLKERYNPGSSLATALGAAMQALARDEGERRELEASSLEVAILDRAREHRTFRRVHGARLERLIEESRGAAGANGDTSGESASGDDTENAAPENPDSDTTKGGE
ncbi:proteasome subunit alpha [Spiractinospora alimapuensis]|uniref:proteasome subunit alpha n=1 Tax=Spiractinospora alimapuensis TaxID=2820884 RepID=UPI001F3A5F72|nr:proteasome subunit alpha [Spiractinospora alimapuensis]QVQ54595.1 proteasome subunit alpha [Spiractinospora alimapuensis]